MQLAGLANKTKNWQEMEDTSQRVLKLDPFSYPAAYLFNAVANLNLNKLDAAEKSAREGIKQDESHRIPKLEHVLGIVLAQKNDFTGASEHLKSYLRLVPTAADGDMVRNQLTQVEKASTEALAAQPQPAKP
jgi:tetratricopeptide (TPR) repeat protein